jgi:hypothetical protein
MNSSDYERVVEEAHSASMTSKTVKIFLPAAVLKINS